LTSIPDAIARLPLLTTLDLTNNLIETLPDGLRQLEHLSLFSTHEVYLSN